jgi:hypothetical protein
MSTLVVRYRPRDSSAADNHALVEAVFDQLEAEQPDGVHYACLRLDDGTFLHIATITTEPNPLLRLGTFTAFSATLAERCDPSNGPQATPAALIGNYRLLA